MTLETPPDVEEYSWMSPDVLGVHSSYEYHWSRRWDAWQVECIVTGKRICSIYDVFCLPMYDVLFRELHGMLPFTIFEVRLLSHMRIAHSKLHPLSWALTKAFEYWCEYQKSAPTVRLFFVLNQVMHITLGKIGLKRSSSSNIGPSI